MEPNRTQGKRSLTFKIEEEEDEEEEEVEEDEVDEDNHASGGGASQPHGAGEDDRRKRAMLTMNSASSNSSSSSRGSGAGGSGGSTARPCCQAQSCNADLSDTKQYYRRHKVCPFHAKAPTVLIGALQQRFCQQCSRFHDLSEFDENKRSCRRRLAGHNERRRKGSSDYHGEVSS